MRGAIRGLTIEIGGDTTKLQAALKGVNSEVVNENICENASGADFGMVR